MDIQDAVHITTRPRTAGTTAMYYGPAQVVMAKVDLESRRVLIKADEPNAKERGVAIEIDISLDFLVKLVAEEYASLKGL